MHKGKKRHTNRAKQTRICADSSPSLGRKKHSFFTVQNHKLPGPVHQGRRAPSDNSAAQCTPWCHGGWASPFTGRSRRLERCQWPQVHRVSPVCTCRQAELCCRFCLFPRLLVRSPSDYSPWLLLMIMYFSILVKKTNVRIKCIK